MKSIAIIGATPDKEKYANKAIHAYLEQGYKVIPVNPKYDNIEGMRVEKLEEIDTDTISVYVKPEIFKGMIHSIPKTVKKAYLNPGTERDDLIEDLKKRNIEPLMTCSILAVTLKTNQ